MTVRSFGRFSLLVAILTLIGCGDGEGTAVQKTKAIVKVQVGGIMPAGIAIGGVAAVVTYSTTKGLSLASVGPSGVASDLPFLSNTSTPGQVRFALINASGFQPGEIATLTFNIAPGSSQVVADDFSVAEGADIISINSKPLPELTVTIASVDIQ